jgi:hypothetical protein
MLDFNWRGWRGSNPRPLASESKAHDIYEASPIYKAIDFVRLFPVYLLLYYYQNSLIYSFLVAQR